MLSDNPTEPDPAGLIIYVGQDKAGHWLVQDSAKRLEGRFVSHAAAMSYAKAEGEIYRAQVAAAESALTPLVPFVQIGAGECALPRAA